MAICTWQCPVTVGTGEGWGLGNCLVYDFR